MEIPSTGPQSLLSRSNADTASCVSEYEERGGRGEVGEMGDARIVWGVDMHTDVSSEEEEGTQ